MIPSSPRRTLIFLALSALAFFLPDLLVPAALSKTPGYLLFSNGYQGVLVVLGFWFGPAICRALVVSEIADGPFRQLVDRALAELQPTGPAARRPLASVTVVEHAAPFIFTAGLRPGRCAVFLSSGLIGRLGADGLCFALARARAHATLSQRLAAVVPAVALAVSFNDIPSGILAWLGVGALLAGCLGLHWVFELAADRRAARAVGGRALAGLCQLLAAETGKAGEFTVKTPARWRLRTVGDAAMAGR